MRIYEYAMPIPRMTHRELVYPELSYKLTGILFRVHNELGRYRPERQYADRFEDLLKEAAMLYQREITIEKAGRPDFIVDNKIIVELKAKRAILKDDYFQTKRYLQTHRKRLGLLVNFRNKYLRPRRVLVNFNS